MDLLYQIYWEINNVILVEIFRIDVHVRFGLE